MWYNSCGMYTYTEDGKLGERVDCGNYSLDQFKVCLGCKHFDTLCEHYVCRRNGGVACLLGHKNFFEPKDTK